MAAVVGSPVTAVGGGVGGLVVAGVCQGAAGAAHVVLALRSEALPQAAGGVGDAGQEDESDENLLHKLN